MYSLTELIYPKFINNQQNIADIILSDYDIDNLVLASYIYETKVAGIHKKVIHLPKNTFSIKKNDINNIEGLFTKIQETIIKEKGIKIMSIRIFKKRAIDLINSHCDNLKKKSFNEFINSLLDLAQKCIENELIILYPESNLLRFMRELISIFHNIKFSSIYDLINNICPNYKHMILFNGKPISFICSIEKESHNNNLEFLRNDILSKSLGESKLSKLREKYKVESVLSLDLNTLVNSFDEVFELDVPMKINQLKLLSQKILFGLRSFETHWMMEPRPKIYNVLIRYFIRLIGLNINMRKLSHWNLPECIFNLFNSNIGLDSKILILLTNNRNNNIKNAIVLQFLNGSLMKISYVNKTDVIGKNLDIKEIYSDLIENEKNIDFIFKFDIDLIKEIIEKCIIKISKISIFKLYRVLKIARKPEYFEVYPNLPIYELFKSKSSFSLLKLLLPIIVDKHEF